MNNITKRISHFYEQCAFFLFFQVVIVLGTTRMTKYTHSFDNIVKLFSIRHSIEFRFWIRTDEKPGVDNENENNEIRLSKIEKYIYYLSEYRIVTAFLTKRNLFGFYIIAW